MALPGRFGLPACCSLKLRVPECNAFRPGPQRAVETTVPSMQRRPQFLAPRRSLLRRDLLDSRGRFLESQPPVADVNAGQCWPVEPVLTKSQRDGSGIVPGFAQAAFEAAPKGSFGGLPRFELRRRVGTLSAALLTVGAAVSMVTAMSGPLAGRPRDILWRVSARPCGALRAWVARAGCGRACALAAWAARVETGSFGVLKSWGAGRARGSALLVRGNPRES